MHDNYHIITNYLSIYYEELEPIEFYRMVFSQGDLQERGNYEKGKYNAIAVEVTREKNANGKEKILRHTVTDDLEKINEMIVRDNFCLMSPISYIGKERNSDNARVLYAIAVDLDGIIIKDDDPVGLRTLFHQIEDIDRLPKPTVIVSSGTGIHLYYILDEPIVLFSNVVQQLQVYKKELTRLIWQGFITELEDNVQYESLFQGFRVVGTVTKKGNRAKAFLIGDKVTMEYMNEFVDDEFKTKEFSYRSKLSLIQAKEKYPEWYEKRIIQKQKKGTWTCKRDLYDWWKRKILTEARTGHRYFCMMTLAIYAQKSGISKEELEKDAFEIMKQFDHLPADEDNRFDEGDVIDALQSYDDRFMTFPINSISYLTDIKIEKNKRNGRKQSQHLERARAVQMVDYPNREWINKEGAPTKDEIVKEWRKNHPNGKKVECIRETGLSKPTVYKWWDTVDESNDKSKQTFKLNEDGEWFVDTYFDILNFKGDKENETKRSIKNFNT